ncbi:MAG: hypothetical protein HY220_03135 [Candidatus Sungbacteria bacterium]|uniref:Uncharacterized protein n=1 Tax=Candidatus Sungiibacteriota bacterium TaxID=2750080 RepID=A0A9D6LQD2_9BACT|nr:hypothetical protein [Candidatus Sungbacteria bacterium]
MDFNEIKKWLTDSSERFIIVEDGRPAFVVMGAEGYRALKGGAKKFDLPRREDPMKTEMEVEAANARLEADRLRAKDLAAKMAMDTALRSFGQSMESEERKEIRLEDLPL